MNIYLSTSTMKGTTNITLENRDSKETFLATWGESHLTQVKKFELDSADESEDEGREEMKYIIYGGLQRAECLECYCRTDEGGRFFFQILIYLDIYDQICIHMFTFILMRYLSVSIEAEKQEKQEQE